MSDRAELVLLSHHKCATNWLRSICKVMDEQGLIRSRTVRGEDKSDMGKQSASAPLVLVNVNASRSTTKDIDFSAQPVAHFVRDPRDAFVSNYWSWLKSHSNNSENIVKFRERAIDMSVEEGLIELLDYFPMGKQLQSWTDDMWSNSFLVRYEDMLTDISAELRRVFSTAGIEIGEDQMSEIKERTSFTKMTKGRQPGEEDVSHHFRKGVSGDWVNYFSDHVQKNFEQRYGDLCVRLGYS